MDLTKEAMRSLFGYLGSFDTHWEGGWRPVFDSNGDILLQHSTGSYARCVLRRGLHRQPNGNHFHGHIRLVS
jgi:hypothetical protein